ncbi:MAG TPA: hypothetical protein VHS78_12305 [Candidatus Elarobacter sp.]|nr:hypothetical protein [Candidatus Elarobacter sp.]
MGTHLVPNTESRENWYAHVADCGGKPLTWCGKNYTFMPMKCGHLEVEIPPGCYVVFAGHSPSPGGRPPFGNRLTHIQVVRANCGDHVCVTLFSPEMWFCGSWFLEALQTQPHILNDPNLAANAARAVQAVLGQIKPTEFSANLEAFKKEAPPKA